MDIAAKAKDALQHNVWNILQLYKVVVDVFTFVLNSNYMKHPSLDH
jgi:hypothetical protein